MKTNSGDKKPDVLHTPGQKRFNDFLSQIKEERTNMDMNLFKEVFGFDTPDQMLQNVHNLKRADSYNQQVIEDIVMDFGDSVKIMSGVDKDKRKKMLKIVSTILDFNLNKQSQQGQGLKILTSNQTLSRLLVSLAQLKAGNNSEKPKNEISQLLYSLYRSKNLQKFD